MKKTLIIILSFAGFPLLSQPVYCTGKSAFPDCEAINCAVCDLNGYGGSTTGFGGDPDNDLGPFFCGTVESVQYVKFYAAVTQLTITLTTVNCSVLSGIDLGVMTICDHPLIACEPGNGTNSTSIFLDQLIVGQLYILIIDVDASSDCAYEIMVDPPDGTTPFAPLDAEIIGDFIVCPNTSSIYQVSPQTFTADYDWTVPPGAEIIDEGAPGKKWIQVHWGDTGGQICATISYPCVSQPVTICHDVIVENIPPTILPEIIVCEEAVPVELPWGETTNSSGIFSHTIHSSEGCDSVLTQPITVLSANIHTLPAFVFCEGDCVTICGQDYCDYGSYSATCPSFYGCDSTIYFSIIPPNLVADILGTGPINCANPTITLSSAASGGIKTWYDGMGQPLGNGGILHVSSPGTYFLTVTLFVGGNACTLSDSIMVLLDTVPPPLTATGTMICDSFPAQIQASSPINPGQYTWTGPNGFASSLQNPPVTALGPYTVTLFNPANGCSSTDTAWVIQCCTTFAGTFDTAQVVVCGPKTLFAGFHFDQSQASGDSLVFILYSNPNDPFGSILLTQNTPIFPFIHGLQQMDSLYYVAALVGSVLADSSLDFQGGCLAISLAQPVMWVNKPSITVVQSPFAACKGDCMDLTFQFTGAPPFQFHFNITQNGVLLFSKDETSDTLQKTVTVCPATFIQPTGSVSLNFNVNFFQDARCNCSD